MNRIKLLLIFSLLSQLSKAQSASESGFAAYLLQTAQYDLATLEYERLLFHHPQNDSLAYQLLTTYRLKGQNQKAIHFASIRQQQIAEPSMRWAFQKEKAHNAVLLKDAILLQSLSKESSEMANTESEKYLARQLLFGTSMVQGSPAIPRYQDQIPLDGMLLQLYNDWENRPQKSPALAATLSAILPGSGKVYAGAWKDGLVSALFVGANAFTAYRGFQNQGFRSPYVWIFGSLTTGFYLGNIFGAHKQAKKYNHQVNTQLTNSTYARLVDLHR